MSWCPLVDLCNGPIKTMATLSKRTLIIGKGTNGQLLCKYNHCWIWSFLFLVLNGCPNHQNGQDPTSSICKTEGTSSCCTICLCSFYSWYSKSWYTGKWGYISLNSSSWGTQFCAFTFFYAFPKLTSSVFRQNNNNWLPIFFPHSSQNRGKS